MSGLFVDNHILWKDNESKLAPSPVELSELIAMKDSMGDLLSLSASALPLYPKAKILFNRDNHTFKLHISCNHKGVDIDVPCINGRFLNYLVCGSLWKRVAGIDGLNQAILDEHIDNPESFSIGSYLSINKKLDSFFAGIPFTNISQDELKNIPDLTKENPASFINAKLYKYQETGLAWLDFMSSSQCGGILADEMGLGKTLQIISLVALKIKEGSNGPFLIVAPVSLIENWRREFKKFAPQVETYIHFGASRTGYFKNLAAHQVVITAYTTLVNDQSVFNPIKWECVFLDEAQAIKNPSAQRTLAVKSLQRKSSFCISGTPFQNHMLDIWSLVDFVMPNYLGSKSDYLARFEDDLDGARQIEPIITPIMLRRTVEEVANDLPDKILIPQAIVMDSLEADIYERIRQETLQEYSSKKTATLPLISRLRQCSANPVLVDSGLGNDLSRYSAKYQRLLEIVEEIVYKREKVIVFTSFVRMIELMQKDLAIRFEIPTYSIYGQTETKERQAIIDRFTEIDGSSVLIINPNAAGTGLNIVAANHVIHYTPEWNPAIEDQATARAYRRGQVKNVFVYHLFYANTVEDFMANKIATKRDMIEEAIVGSKGECQTIQDIVAALSLSPKEDSHG